MFALELKVLWMETVCENCSFQVCFNSVLQITYIHKKTVETMIS